MKMSFFYYLTKRNSFKIIIFSITLFLSFNSQSFGQQRLAKINKRNNEYSIRINKAEILISPLRGGRISALKFDNNNFLTDSTVNEFNWGSSFWTSPQSDWNWPPSSEIDNAPYKVSLINRTLIMESKPDPRTGLFVTKRFKGILKGNFFFIEYIITNSSKSDVKVAPWEVTRVHPNGLSFFPKGQEDSLRGGLSHLIKIKDSVLWFKYEAKDLPIRGDRQLYTDGSEGWFAQINNGIIFVKKFPDIHPRDFAPKEGEIELYVSPVKEGHSYVEIEQQGKFQTLRPGESFSWQMKWYLRKLPANLKAEIGNKKLLHFVRSLIEDI